MYIVVFMYVCVYKYRKNIRRLKQKPPALGSSSHQITYIGKPNRF